MVDVKKKKKKVNNSNIRSRCEICTKFVVKTPEQRQWHCSTVCVIDSFIIFYLLDNLHIKNILVKTEKETYFDPVFFHDTTRNC